MVRRSGGLLGWLVALSCDRLEREVLAIGGNPSGMWEDADKISGELFVWTPFCF